MTARIGLVVVAALTLSASAAEQTAQPLRITGLDVQLEQSVIAIAEQVEQLRGQRFDRPPLAIRVSDDIREVAAQIRAFHGASRERLAARGRAWSDVGLGVTASPAALLELLATDLDGIGFDPQGNRLLVAEDRLTEADFALVEGERDSSTVLMMTGVRPDEPLVGHMLVHVRQRERLGGDYFAPTTDRLLAQAAWAEGEANLVAVRYLFHGMGLADDVIGYGLDPGEFLDGSLLPRGLDQLSGATADLARFVYIEGYAQAVLRFRAGGWPALERAMAQGTSTRAVLHPELAGEAAAGFDEPQPPVAGLVAVDQDVLGEQGLVTLISWSSGKDNLALQAGDGWDGDLLVRWEPAPGSTLSGGATEWLTRWRSDEDVEDFLYAFRRALRTRFPDSAPETLAAGVTVVGTPERLFRVERRERQVRVLVLSAELAGRQAEPDAQTVAPAGAPDPPRESR